MSAEPSPRIAPNGGRRPLSGPEFLHEFVFKAGAFIPSDINRAINQADGGNPAPNFMLALSLLCTTEAVGRFEPTAPMSGRGIYSKRFNLFLRRMGKCYADQLNAGTNIYGSYRCGMAHSYLIEGDFVVAIRPRDPDACGIYKEPGRGGRRVFIVVPYFTHLMAAAHDLYVELLGGRHPMAHVHLPGIDMKLPPRLPPGYGA